MKERFNVLNGESNYKTLGLDGSELKYVIRAFSLSHLHVTNQEISIYTTKIPPI